MFSEAAIEAGPIDLIGRRIYFKNVGALVKLTIADADVRTIIGRPIIFLTSLPTVFPTMDRTYVQAAIDDWDTVNATATNKCTIRITIDFLCQ